MMGISTWKILKVFSWTSDFTLLLYLNPICSFLNLVASEITSHEATYFISKLYFSGILEHTLKNSSTQYLLLYIQNIYSCIYFQSSVPSFVLLGRIDWCIFICYCTFIFAYLNKIQGCITITQNSLPDLTGFFRTCSSMLSDPNQACLGRN